ncbi:hypothetical protein [Pseudomonas sp. CGJS7]|uniref:hypothetical protein n=1 Tax=Pseudomonas sp. CGJS7 TaxID=3109348 RepID=UPI0030080715
MKLNPFAKKQKNANPSRYDELCAEFNEVDAQLKEAEQLLTQAQTDYSESARAYHELERRSNSTTWSAQEQSLFAESNRALAHLRDRESALNTLSLKHRDLRWRVEAPSSLKADKAELQRLTERRAALQADVAKARARTDQLQRRADSLHAEIEAERAAATQALIDSDSEDHVISLPSRQAEFEVVVAAQNQVQERIAAIEAELQQLPDLLRKAEHAICCSQAFVAETELEAELPGFIGIIARYTVAQRRARYGGSEDTHEIKIPHEAREAARARLDAEMRA